MAYKLSNGQTADEFRGGMSAEEFRAKWAEKTITVRVGGEGFHGDYSREITVPESRYWPAERIAKTYQEPMWFPSEMVAVDEATLNSLGRDACGMTDCCCGSGPVILDTVGDLYLIAAH